mmetsp:Transcript_7684/g.16029  ORF Transcript_7684/g.16029 Transcript_7684/m.16029 type:complete len:202 (+) Transcript_7684:363-968(+)
MRSCGIGRGPNLGHFTVGIAIATRLVAVGFHGNIQMMSLLRNIAGPPTRKIHNMTGTIVGPLDTIILCGIPEVSNVQLIFLIEILNSFRGGLWRSLGNLVGSLTIVGTFIQAIIFPCSGTQKGLGQRMSIFLCLLNAQIRQEGGIFLGRESRDKPGLRTQGSQSSRSFNDFLRLQLSQSDRMTRPHFRNGVGTRNIILIRW